MKTLLLSLIGIVGSTSSSIIPVVMNNHYNVNQIKKAISGSKDFSYTLNTNYPDIAGGKVYRYDNELSNFISEVKEFVKREKVTSWKIVTGKSIAHGEHGSKDFQGNVLTPLNEALHADNITEVTQWAVVSKSPDPENPWEWDLKGQIIADGKSYVFPHLDAFGSEDDKYTADDLSKGFTNTFGITYTADEDKIDIGVGNNIDSPITEMDFLSTTTDDFQNNITVHNASDILQKLGFDVNPEWLSFKEAIWLEANEKVDEKLLNGELGAGQYHIKVTVAANNSGIENNIVGEMTFFMTLKFNYGDLYIFNNRELELTEISYVALIKQIDTGIRSMVITHKNATALLELVSLNLFKMTEIYDSETNEQFTEDSFDKLSEGKTINLYTFAYPTENGKKLGLLNSAKILIKFKKEKPSVF